MPVTAPLLYSAEDYLKQERTSDVRHEYHLGEIFAMAGASRNHNRIVTNLSTLLDTQLQNRPCNNYSNDMRISVQNGARYLYPDVVVTCGDELFEDEESDTLQNPLVVIEVLSPSTEAYDRGLKFVYYQGIPSLQEYLLISQDPPGLELYRKQVGGQWTYQAFYELPVSVSLESVGCVVESEAVFRKVEMKSTR